MISSSVKTAVNYSHSKLILAGEHAVVYGKPAIAIPFPLEVKATITEKPGVTCIESAYYTGSIDQMPGQLQGIAACIKETLKYLVKPLEGLHICIESAIPIGRGLGSSAAIAIAIVKGLFTFYSQEASAHVLSSLVNIAEVYAHGNPSGLDAAAEISDVPVWFQKGKGAVPLRVGAPLILVVADTGRIGNTLKAVTNVKEKYLLDSKRTHQLLERAGEITIKAKHAMFSGDIMKLGQLLNENHLILDALGVSDAGLNHLVEIAKLAGALGAKLTGGGQGGCMFALAGSLGQAKIIADCLVDAGAAKTWYFKTEY